MSVRFILQISLCFHPLHGYSIFPRGRKNGEQILRFTGQNTANWLLWYFVQQNFVRIFRKYLNCATVWVEHTYDRFKSKSNSAYWLWPVYALSVPVALLDYLSIRIHDIFLAKIFISHNIQILNQKNVGCNYTFISPGNRINTTQLVWSQIHSCQTWYFFRILLITSIKNNWIQYFK